ncbi:MAG: outer membrane beta-barrel protein [Deltaproteobacteria bacterium]|nr:outer membrane beta-barrel protein [Deltaproteobacteria bacterium]
MNRFNLFLLLALCGGFLSLPVLTQALPIGGLARPMEKGHGGILVDMGYAQRDMDQNQITTELRSRQGSLRGTYALWDFLSLSAIVGLMDYDTGTNVETTLNGAYGAAIKGLLFRGQTTRLELTADGRFLYYSAEDNSIDIASWEYQFALNVVYRAENVLPYIGLDYNNLDVQRSGASDLESQDNFGVVLGLDYFVNPNVYFYGEMHNFNQDAISLGVGFKF